jgi:hypothetical protein
MKGYNYAATVRNKYPSKYIDNIDFQISTKSKTF